MANKIIILQLALRKEQTQYMTDSGGVWYNDFRNVWTGIASDVSQDFTAEDVQDIIQVSYNGIDLTHVTSYTDTVDGRATALSADPSFIFDGADNILYFRLDDYDDPRGHTINVGGAIHISDQAYDDTVNELLYRPDLMNIPELTEEKDPLFFQKMAFNEVTQDINNSEYKYDSIINNKIYGQRARYLEGDPSQPVSTFTQMQDGKVKSYRFSDGKVSLRIIDSRTKLSRSIPTNALDQTTYPDLKDDYIGTPKPLVYGFVKEHLCIPLDDDAVQTNYTFLIADTEFHPIKSTGYTIIMDDVDKTANVLNFSAANGTFQLPAAHYTVDKDVTFTGFGFMDGADAIDNTLDIVLDLMANYADIAYTSNSFNTTEWDYETTLAGNNGIAIPDSKPLIEVIADIAAEGNRTTGGFLLQRDGLYTWRTYDSTANPVLTVYNNMWKREPSVTGDSEEILSSATTKFNQSINSKKWSRYTDDSQEGDIYSDFGEYQDKEFDTILTSAADAQTLAESIMERSDDEQKIITGILDDKYVDYATVKIGKIAQIEVDHQIDKYTYSTWLGKMRCEILKVTPNTRNRECEIVYRKIEDIDEFALSCYRITEAGDYRITEAGDFRITEVGCYG